jgi:hypothetical protein
LKTKTQIRRFLAIAPKLILMIAGLLLYVAAQAGTSGRSKVIDFDDDVVEGLNKRPLDSLSQISERNKRQKKPHLYRKRTGYRYETTEMMKTIQYTTP